MDVPQDANGLPDNAAVTAWAAGSQIRMDRWYDQSGNARHATQATFANMPLYDASGARGQAAAYRAFRAAIFDGFLDVPAGNIRKPKKLVIPTSATYLFENHTVLSVIDPKSAIYNDIYWTLPRSAGGAEALALGTAASNNGVYSAGGGNTAVSGRRARQAYQTLGYASNSTNFRIAQDGLSIPLTAKWTDPLAGGTLGDGIPGSSDFMSSDNQLAFLIYPTALSDAHIASVNAALISTFGLVTPATSQVVGVGDSIWYGATVKESLEARSTTRLIRPVLTGTPAIYNMGISSQLLTGGGGMAANAATREFALVDLAFAKRVLFIEIGINDIGANVTAATLYAALTTYITNARAAGFTHIVVRTLLPCSQSPGQITERNAYNALVRANSAGADAISDVAAHPIMGNVANIGDLSLYQDALHPTGYGNELIAPIDAAAINSVL